MERPCVVKQLKGKVGQNIQKIQTQQSHPSNLSGWGDCIMPQFHTEYIAVWEKVEVFRALAISIEIRQYELGLTTTWADFNPHQWPGRRGIIIPKCACYLLILWILVCYDIQNAIKNYNIHLTGTERGKNQVGEIQSRLNCYNNFIVIFKSNQMIMLKALTKMVNNMNV